MNRNDQKPQRRLRQYIKLWIILVAVYCAVTFIFVGSNDGEPYTFSFWVGFVLTCIELCFQFVCAWIALRDINFAKSYREIYLATVTYIAFFGTLILGIASMMLKPVPYWLGSIISILLLAGNVFFLRKAADLSEFKESWKKSARVRKIILIAIPVVCIVVGGTLLVTRFIIPNGKYNDAKDLVDAGKYEEAVAMFASLNGFKDSDAQIENCYVEMYGADDYSEIHEAQVGGTYTLGDYYGKIEWLILDKEGSKLLLLSKECLESMPYNTEYEGVTWETSTIRSWLNGEFMDEAFSEEEKSMILTVDVPADVNTVYPTEADADQGNATRDQVFLLSVVEAERYFGSDAERIAMANEHAIENGAIAGNDGESWWWLRTSGELQNFAACVYGIGEIYYHGRNVSSAALAVRPAMWIDLDA